LLELEGGPRERQDRHGAQETAAITVTGTTQVNVPAFVAELKAWIRFSADELGILTPFLNQPIEVGSIRPQFASARGLGDQRPDLVVRFGRGSTMRWSLRRPVRAVLV
jgi:hypothetical protein